MAILRIFETFLLLAALSRPAQAYRILTDVNTLTLEDIGRNPDGSINYNNLQRIKSDGVWHLAGPWGNPRKPKLTKAEQKKIFKHLGPGYIVLEDGSYTTVNYNNVKSLFGYVNDYMSYNEKWMYPRFSKFVPYRQSDCIWPIHRTVLRGDQIDWVKANSRSDRLSVLTRSYTDTGWEHAPSACSTAQRSWKRATDGALSNPKISSVTVEMFPSVANYQAWKIADLINKALGQNKQVYLLLSENRPTTDAVRDYADFVAALRSSVNLSDPRIFLVVANYGPYSTVTWLAGEPNNSIEGIIKFMKSQREWEGNRSAR